MSQTFIKVITIHALCLYFLLISFSDQSLKHLYYDVGEIETNIATTDEIPLVKPTKPTSIYFTGDVMLARHVEYLMTVKGTDYPFLNFDTIFDQGQYIFGNFEATIPKIHKKTPNFAYSFSVKNEYAKVLAEKGFTHVSLANNHTLDYGVNEFDTTKSSLIEAGLEVIGHPEIVSTSSLSILEMEGGKVGVLAIHTLTSYPKSEVLDELLTFLNSSSDYQVVFIHWGNEYEKIPSASQKDFAQELASFGVDVIIGHHPHVVQSVDKIDDTLIFNSLGNFIFDQYFSREVQEGLVLKLQVGEQGIEVSLIPVTSIGSSAQPRLMNDIEGSEFLKNLAEISTPSLKEAILIGNLKLPTKLASSTEMAIMGQ